MSASVIIRSAKSNDARSLLALVKRLARESDTITVNQHLNQIAVNDEAHQLSVIERSGSYAVIVAQLSRRLIGIATVRSSGQKTGELGLAVLRRYWNHGLGTELVKSTLEWFKNHSQLNQLWLIVKRRNRAALHVYTKCGFKIIGKVDFHRIPVIKMAIKN